MSNPEWSGAWRGVPVHRASFEVEIIAVEPDFFLFLLDLVILVFGLGRGIAGRSVELPLVLFIQLRAGILRFSIFHVIPTEEAGKTGHLDMARWGIEDLSVRIVLIGFCSVLLADISEVGKRVDSARATCWPLELDSVMTYRTRLRLLEP